jgi:ferrous iron transport protein A
MQQGGMPLALARANIDLVVTGFAGGGCGFQRRLADLGIVPGVPVRVVGGGYGGPAILELRGCRLGLGRGLIQRILVKEAGE